MNQNLNEKTVTDLSHISLSMRWLIWFGLFSLSVAIGISEAVISSAAIYIKKTLFIRDMQFGSLEAFYNFGRAIGSFIFLFSINRFNRKKIIIIPMLIKAMTLIAFIFSKNFYSLFALRTIAGSCSVFPMIYFPLWIEQYCVINTRYIMLTWIMISIPLGKGIGFGFTYIMSDQKWPLMLVIEALFILLIILAFVFFPNFYFSNDLIAVRNSNTPNENSATTFVRRSSKIVTVFPSKGKNQNEHGLCSQICEILCNRLFIFLILSRITLLALNSVLIFFLPSYMRDVLQIENRKERMFIYVTILLCSPIIGGVICHLITIKIEGYEHKAALIIPLVINIISTAAFVAAPFITDWYYFTFCAMIYKTSINAIVPIINGIILTSMPLDLKAISFTLSAMFNVFFGFGLSVPLYEVIYSFTSEDDKTFAMKCFSFYSILAVLWLFLATITRHIQDEQYKQQYRISNPESVRLSQDYASSHVSNSINDDIINDIGDQLEIEYESENSDIDVMRNLTDYK